MVDMGLIRKAASLVINKTKDSQINLDADRSDYVGVSLTNEGWKAIQQKPMGKLSVKVRKLRKPIDGHDYSVSLTDGTLVGYLLATDFSRSGAKTRGSVLAEVRRGFGSTSKSKRLYLRITEDAARRANMDTHISIPRDRWRGPDEGFDVMSGKILERTKGDVTTYVIRAAGFNMCEVSPDMRCYKTVAERANLTPRRIIANLKAGNFEPYYSVYLYF